MAIGSINTPDFIIIIKQELSSTGPHSSHACEPASWCFTFLLSEILLGQVYVCDKYMSSNPGRVILLQYQFSKLVWKQSMTAQNTVTSFKTTGVYPVNHHAIFPSTNHVMYMLHQQLRFLLCCRAITDILLCEQEILQFIYCPHKHIW